jgi:fibronectin-binding autotransporter adhesin
MRSTRQGTGKKPRIEKWIFGKRAALFATAISGLTGIARASDGTWSLNGSGTWDALTDSANWVGGVAASGAGATADFTTVNITANQTVTLGANITVGNINVADAVSSNDWTLATGSPAHTLTLDGGTPTITVNDASRTFTVGAAIAGSLGLTKGGTGSLTLTASPLYTGVTTINGGALALNLPAGTTLSPLTTYTVNSATLNFNFNGTLNLSSGNMISGTGTTILSQGTLILGNSTAISGTTLQINSGTLAGSGTDISFARPVILNGNASVIGTQNFSFTNLVSGIGGNRF